MAEPYIGKAVARSSARPSALVGATPERVTLRRHNTKPARHTTRVLARYKPDAAPAPVILSANRNSKSRLTIGKAAPCMNDDSA